jgi:hypothetical protein
LKISDPTGGVFVEVETAEEMEAALGPKTALVLSRRGRWSPYHTALSILYEESLMKYTGWCENDLNVQG